MASLLGQLDKLIRTIQASCARLHLEGPHEVAASGEAVLTALRVVDNNLVTWKQSRASSPESQAEYIERHTVKAADLADSINGFANKASTALDATG